MKADFGLIKRNNGYYYSLYREDGTRQYRTTGKKRKAEALRYVLELRGKGELNIELPLSRSITIKEYSKNFYTTPDKCPILLTEERRGKPLKNGTIVNARQALLLHIFPLIGSSSISSFTPQKAENFLYKLPTEGNISNATANLVFVYLKAIFNQAKKDGLITTNPCDMVKPLKDESKKTEAFTIEEIRALFNLPWNNPINKLACKTSALTGMRFGEVDGLRVEDLKEGYIEVNGQIQNGKYITPKSGKTRVTPAPQSLIDELRELAPDDHGYIFRKFTSSKLPITRNTVAADLENHLKALSITGKTFHSFRAFYNTYMVSTGSVSGDLLRAVIGHASESMTDHYMHLESADLDAVHKAQEEILI